MEVKKAITRLSGVLTAIVFTAISLAAQSHVGYVLEIRGTWVLNGSNSLSAGVKLPAGGSIRRESSSANDNITIADMRGYILESASRNCGNGNCSGLIILPHKAPSRSWWGAAITLADSLMARVRTSPRRQGLYETRSGDLSEDVVKLSDGNVDLSSVLKPQGEQYLRWRVASPTEDSATDWTKPTKLDKTALVSGFHPGLYEISLVRSNGSNFEPIAAAWILVATPADFARLQASFQDVQALTKKWGDKVRPETKRRFLQASLENLAHDSAK